jgi:hypothetical protein
LLSFQELATKVKIVHYNFGTLSPHNLHFQKNKHKTNKQNVKKKKKKTNKHKQKQTIFCSKPLGENNKQMLHC